MTDDTDQARLERAEAEVERLRAQLAQARGALVNAREFGRDSLGWHHPKCVETAATNDIDSCRCWEAMFEEADRAIRGIDEQPKETR